MNKLRILLATGLLAILLLPGCYSDNEYDLYPFAPCDSVNVTYSQTIAPIMTANCNSCHNAAMASGGIVTDNYQTLNEIATNGRLWGAVTHASGFQPMPQNTSQLSTCDLAKIRQWISTGSQNN